MDRASNRIERTRAANADPDQGFRFGLSQNLLDQPLNFSQPKLWTARGFDRRFADNKQLALRIKYPGADDRSTQVNSNDDFAH
jgi:hypothetical protein